MSHDLLLNVSSWTALATTSSALVDQRAESEASLVNAARDGDPDAFTSLVRLHQQRVFQLCRRFYSRPEDVEDRAQEAFLTAWRKLHTFRGRAPFEHWLTRVTLNCCYQDLRRNRERRREDGLDLETLTSSGGSPTATLEAQRLLAHLKPPDRFLLVLLDGMGWTTREAAERLGWTRTNVKVRAFRARSRLRRLLEQQPPGEGP